jgi:dTDP-4-amino-4,6-dideoxygalactose transaminase
MRRQPPAASPLSAAKLSLAALDALASAGDARDALGAYLSERFRAEAVLLTGSGTQALQVALARATRRTGPGAPVALPAYSCYDLVSAAVGAGARVVFYDVDPVSLTPDPDSLDAAIDAGARTVVAASLYGFPLDWGSLRRTCQASGALLVEDSAQGLGSGWAGAEGGTFGDLTVLSFGRGKGWTGGSGGALLIRARTPTPGSRAEGADAPTAGAPEALPGAPPLAGAAALAAVLAQWALGRPALYRLPGLVPGLALGETRYRPPASPARMSGFAAAAALRHASLALEAVPARRGRAGAWHELRDESGALPEGSAPCQPLAAGECGWLRCPLVAPDGARADRLAREATNFGVARGYPVALPDLPAAAPLLAGAPGAFPGARRLAETLLTLPTHAAVARSDLRGVERVLRRAASSRLTPK